MWRLRCACSGERAGGLVGAGAILAYWMQLGAGARGLRRDPPTCPLLTRDGDGGSSQGHACPAGGLEQQLHSTLGIGGQQAQLARRPYRKLRPVLQRAEERSKRWRQ